MRWNLVRRVSLFGMLLGIAVLAAVACGDDDGAGPEPTGTVQGTVEDQDGAPVSGVTVTLSRTGGPSRTATTGGNGSFSFAQVEAGAWSLEVAAPSGYTVPSSQQNPQSITVTAGQTTTVAVKLDNDGETTAPGGPPNAITVRMQGLAFSPQVDTVALGGTVTWRNDDAVAHNTTSDDNLWSSGTMDTGDTYSHTFSEEGTFPYECTLHAGMTGTIVVMQ